jgi:transcriptional regulator with XRE-family HTH domain
MATTAVDACRVPGENDLPQVEVARRLGRSQSFVTKAETGERRLDVVELRALARVYRKWVSFFCGK